MRFVVFVMAVLCALCGLNARAAVTVVSSNSMYRFTTLLAEEFARRTEYRAPVVQPVGTGLGFKQFCAKQTDTSNIDIILSSRPIFEEERDLCIKNGFGELKQVLLGRSAAVLVARNDNPITDLSVLQLATALADKVPVDARHDSWAANRHASWSSIDPKLPKIEIEIYGPSDNVTAHELISERVLAGACEHACCEGEEMEKKRKFCREFRHDRHYIPGNDTGTLTLKKLSISDNAVGFVTYDTYIENNTTIKAVKINGVMPTVDSIRSGHYAVARDVYLYVKVDSSEQEYVQSFLRFAQSNAISGKGGILESAGLVKMESGDGV